MEEYLGVEVPDDTRGVLQDTHWGGGAIGYFPTYALGNVISLQLWAVVREAIPDIDDQMRVGELQGLSTWLTENLYSLGRVFASLFSKLICYVSLGPRCVPLRAEKSWNL